MKKNKLISGREYFYYNKYFDFPAKGVYIYCGTSLFKEKETGVEYFITERNFKYLKPIKKEGHPSTSIFKLND